MAAPSWDSIDDLTERFENLTAFLLRYQPLWSGRPFMEDEVGWESLYPALSRWLRGLDSVQVERHELSPHLTADCPAFLQELAHQSASLGTMPQLPAIPLSAPAWQSRHIPGRKWSQIQAFGACSLPHLSHSPQIVDWCAGKGHLGRSLSGWRDAGGVVAIERSEALCDQGVALAGEQGRAVRFLRRDVFDGDVQTLKTAAGLHAADGLVSLHACGDLSVRALQLVLWADLRAAALSPCCFHSIASSAYVPLSGVGQQSGLRLDRRTLRLPSQEEVAATARDRRLRRRELSYRAGLDLLRRVSSGVDRYQPQPSLPRSFFGCDFETFCHRASARMGFSLPAGWSPSAAERAGAQRAQTARALAMVMAPFRRLIEVWVTLDRALWIAERGRWVCVGTFCSRGLTPRNLMMLVGGEAQC